MFGGIVESLGIVSLIKISPSHLDITITPQLNFSDIALGDSIAVNGVCLTVTAFTENTFTAMVVPETMRLTNLNDLVVGSKVNLERALPVNGRIGGHYVQGHVDSYSTIIDLQPDGANALLVKIATPPTLAKYLINKGYIAIDGMSITIIEATSVWFTVTFIPHTRAVTVASQYQQGTKVNLEVDILGKYLEKLLPAHIA
jgi:riboflavin synthase